MDKQIKEISVDMLEFPKIKVILPDLES